MRLRHAFRVALLALLLLSLRAESQTTVPVTDPSLVFSPYNWTIPGLGASPPPSPMEIVTNEPGAYFMLRFANSSQVALNLDLHGTPPGGGTTTLMIQYSIDGVLYPKQTLNNIHPDITLATGLDSSPHTLQVWFVSSAYDVNRWARTATLANGYVAPPQSLRVAGVTLDSNATVLNATGLRPKRMLFYGDSITEGVSVLPSNDALQTYAVTCARLLNAEYGIVANAGQGWTLTTTLTTGVPLFGDAYTLQYDQTPRFPTGNASSPPDYVVVNMGTNDRTVGDPSDPGVTNAILHWLQEMRTYFPSSQVFLVVPFGGFVEPALESAYNQYLLFNPTDKKIHFINLGLTAQTGLTASSHGFSTLQSFDGQHPNAATQQLLGYQLAAAMQTALGCNDFDGDGKSDLILQNTGTNQIADWFLNNAKVLNGALLSGVPAAAYQVVGSADFDGDGRPDYLFQNRLTGQLAIWFMSGTTNRGGIVLPPVPAGGYKVVGVGDFNGDGKPDILFQHETSNQIVVWFMDVGTLIGGVVLPQVPAAGYHVVGTADFNRDGRNDLLFQNDTSGILVLWYLNGTQFVGGEAVSTSPAVGYQVEAIADYDDDGRPDIVLRHADGHIVLWHLDGANLFQADNLSLQLPAPFRVVGPR